MKLIHWLRLAYFERRLKLALEKRDTLFNDDDIDALDEEIWRLKDRRAACLLQLKRS